jgi:flagellar hook-associated protein 1
MPSPFHSIETASRALRAFQRGLDVTGHNLANVNTRGYSRQAVDFVQSDPTSFYGIRSIALGTGVSVASVNRIRDVFLDQRMLEAGADHSRFESYSNGLAQADPIFNETTGRGISNALTAFFNAWSDLSANPNQPAALMGVQQAGSSLATKIRSAHRDLTALGQQLRTSMSQTLQDADRLAAQIAELNGQIRTRVAAGETPGDLLDQRDLALDDLSKLADVSVARKNDGSVTVFLNGFTMVDEMGAYPVPKTADPAAYTISNGTKTYQVDSGKLFGLMEAANRVTAYQAELDTLANTLRTEINAVHASGINSNGTTGNNFFADLGPPQTGASDFDLDDKIKGDIRNIAAGATGSKGDGGLALAISQMRDQPSALLGSKKFSEFYAELVASVGRDALSAETSRDTKRAIVQQIELQRQSVSGVSMDEEMANMLKFQRSYQAAAKALSIFNEVTEDLLAMVR